MSLKGHPNDICMIVPGASEISRLHGQLQPYVGGLLHSCEGRTQYWVYSGVSRWVGEVSLRNRRSSAAAHLLQLAASRQQ